VYGTTGNAVISYWAEAFLHRSDAQDYRGQVKNLYRDGIIRNIATFYGNVTECRFENPTVRRAVDGVLTCVLGREAASRRVRLSMDELLKENGRLEVDLAGLQT